MPRAPGPGPAIRSAPTTVLPTRRLPSRRHPLRHNHRSVHDRRRLRSSATSAHRWGRKTGRRATSVQRRRPVNRRCRCRIRFCRRPASEPERRAAVPTITSRRPRACAASATSPPMPTISAVPPRKPAAPREKPTPMCLRPRRSSIGSSRAWKITAPTPTRPIRMMNRWRKPSATRRRPCNVRGRHRSEAASQRPCDREPCSRSRARSQSASF